MNARYYDPQLGMFLSPDTLVPDPTLLIDYNRYLYSRGNPLKYNDPTGHYSDEAIMQHLGCSDWACVEANFQEGGRYSGLWGWLDTLTIGEDGNIADTLLSLWWPVVTQSPGLGNCLPLTLCSCRSHGSGCLGKD